MCYLPKHQRGQVHARNQEDERHGRECRDQPGLHIPQRNSRIGGRGVLVLSQARIAGVFASRAVISHRPRDSSCSRDAANERYSHTTLRIECGGRPHLGRRAWEPEPWRHDANNRSRGAAEGQRLTDEGRIGAELLPERMADHRRALRARQVWPATVRPTIALTPSTSKVPPSR